MLLLVNEEALLHHLIRDIHHLVVVSLALPIPVVPLREPRLTTVLARRGLRDVQPLGAQDGVALARIVVFPCRLADGRVAAARARIQRERGPARPRLVAFLPVAVEPEASDRAMVAIGPEAVGRDVLAHFVQVVVLDLHETALDRDLAVVAVAPLVPRKLGAGAVGADGRLVDVEARAGGDLQAVVRREVPGLAAAHQTLVAAPGDGIRADGALHGVARAPALGELDLALGRRGDGCEDREGQFCGEPHCRGDAPPSVRRVGGWRSEGGCEGRSECCRWKLTSWEK